MSPDASTNLPTPTNEISQAPTNIGPSPDSANDSANKSNWSSRSLKATSLSLVGFAAATTLNQYSPCSFGQSLLRYTISQMPALFYLMGTTKIDPSLMVELNKKMEASAFKEAGISEGAKICAAQCVVWLNDPQEFPNPDRSRLNAAHREIYKDNINRYEGIKNHLRSTGWECDEEYIARSDKPEYGLPLAKAPPVEILKNKQALLCIMTPKEENTEAIPHICVALKMSESELIVYDPSASIPFKAQNTHSCIQILFALAEAQGQEFYLYTRAVPNK
ncbi:hypothetical protein [Endozoicomonas sp. ONNA2]|uniref:hypothetical protein n=1 Tax=Endozoicomonas sp. ONNA2 TaxID=2828741 RepID=UPI002149248D|nr:hypothetical protein [Endozoicomonas sp. ONNA2]